MGCSCKKARPKGKVVSTRKNTSRPNRSFSKTRKLTPTQARSPSYSRLRSKRPGEDTDGVG